MSIYLCVRMFIDNLKFLLKIILKNWYVAGINNCKKKTTNQVYTN